MVLRDGTSRKGLTRTLFLALVLVLLASLLPPLFFGAAMPADAQQELNLSSDGATLSIEPAVIPSGTIGEEVILTVAPGPWPDEFDLRVFDFDGFGDLSDVLSVQSTEGSRLTAVFTQNLSDGRYEVFAQELSGGFGGPSLGRTEFLVGQGTSYSVVGTVRDSSGLGVADMCVTVETMDGSDFANTLTDVNGQYRATLLVSDAAGTALPALISVGDCSDRNWPTDVYVAAEGEQVISDVSLSADTPLQQDWTVYRAATVQVTVRDEQGRTLDCGRTLGPLGPGEHTLIVANCFDGGVRYADVWVGDTRNPEQAEVLEIGEGQRLTRTVTTSPAGFVRGSITDAAMGGSASSCVQVFERIDGVRTFASQRVFPAATMEYELAVGAGAPVLEFSACEFANWRDGSVDTQPFPYRTQFFDRASTLADASPVPLGTGQTVSGIDAALVAGDGFSDVPGDHPFVTEIEWAVARGVTTGFPDGTFRPTVAVTRQAAAAFLYRLAGEPPVTSEAGFADVPSDHPFHDEIAWLVAEGITTGFPDDTFRPTQPVTRQAAAAFLYRFDGQPAASGQAGFPDVPSDHPFETEIAWLVGEQITTGFPNGEFRPVNDVTRQAMAAFLNRYETQ